MKNRESLIKALAYLHRYGWVFAMFICYFFTRKLYTVGIFAIIYSIWSAIGYALKWKHIYCSIQSTHRMQMTPDKIDWSNIRNGEGYGVPAFFFLLGIGVIIVPLFL